VIDAPLAIPYYQTNIKNALIKVIIEKIYIIPTIPNIQIQVAIFARR